MKTLQSLLGTFRVDQATHDALVHRTAEALSYNGNSDIHADVPGYITPARIFWRRTNEGHVPDVTAGRFIIEVETERSLDLEHTRSQCELFSAFAQEHDRTFVVVVPLGYKGRMEWQLVDWLITATVWEM